MGAVYLARNVDLDRQVAIKVLGPSSPSERRELSQRMRREAQALARIDHPNVVTVHDVNLEHDRPVIEMEYIDGETLRAWQERTPGWREVVATYVAVGEGVAAIHAAGLVHRDIKPDNLLLGANGRVKLVDLGLAIGPHRPGVSAPTTTDDSLLNARLTRNKGLVGTPAYLAPECVEQSKFGSAADQFAFAVSLYEALYGVLPFPNVDDADRHARALKDGQLYAPEVPVRLPGWLRGVLRRSLRYEPHDRYPTMNAVVDELRRGLGKSGWWRRASLGVATALGLAAAGWSVGAGPENPCDALDKELATNPALDAWSTPTQPHVARARQQFTKTYSQRWGRWRNAEVAHCEAKHRRSAPEYEDALRTACLNHVRKQLETVAQGPAPPDLLPAETLVEASKQLERLPACTEAPERLAAWAFDQTGPTSDAIRERLVRAQALERLGNYDAAAAAASGAVAESKTHFPRLHAEAQHRLGHIFGSAGRGRDARQTLSQARNAALGAGHELLLCEVIAYRAKLNALVVLDPVGSADDIGLADACIELTDPQSILVRADMLEARGLLASAIHAHLRAIAWHRQALDLRESHLGRQSYETSKSLQNLANALGAAGQTDEAVRTMYQAFAARTAALGESHPKVADVLFDLGGHLRDQGTWKPAHQALTRARQLYSLAYAPNTAHNSRVELELGLLALDQGRLSDAKKPLERARELQQLDEELGIDHPDREGLLLAEGNLLMAHRDFAAALERFAAATAMHRRRSPHSNDIHDGTLREVQMLYGLQDHEAIAQRVESESAPLLAHITSMAAADRGRFAWYIGHSSLETRRNTQATAYLRVAIDAYKEMDQPQSVAELAVLLAQASQVITSATTTH